MTVRPRTRLPMSGSSRSMARRRAVSSRMKCARVGTPWRSSARASVWWSPGVGQSAHSGWGHVWFEAEGYEKLAECKRLSFYVGRPGLKIQWETCDTRSWPAELQRTSDSDPSAKTAWLHASRCAPPSPSPWQPPNPPFLDRCRTPVSQPREGGNEAASPPTYA